MVNYLKFLEHIITYKYDDIKIILIQPTAYNSNNNNK